MTRPRILICLLAAFAWLLGAISPSVAESRIALVIGNGGYGPEIGRLANPPRDARLIADALESAGFQVVTVRDADQKAMKRAISDFGKRLEAAGKDAVGLFFYAGHGVQVGGANYLIPIQADIGSEADIGMEAVDANWVLKQMEFAGNRMNIVVLDACRNNPLARSTRSAELGLARMDAPTGSFIAYSTAPGQVALDGSGSENSPYAKALASAIRKDAGPIEELFRNVRVKVMAATGNKQVPWDSSSLTGAFYFGGKQAGTALAAIQPEPEPATPDPDAGSTVRSQAPAQPGAVFQDCPDCPALVSIPAGTARIGSPAGEDGRLADEGPQHRASIPAFALMTGELTRDQFAAFVKATGRPADPGCYLADDGNGTDSPDASWREPGFKQSGKEPVLCVSWYDARDYAAWLSAKTGRTYRLPSEAEWEYAARAGSAQGWAWGDGPIDATACESANGMDRSAHAAYPAVEPADCDDKHIHTAPVGSYAPNGFKLHDMSGNVWEWTQDCYHAGYDGAPADGSAWDGAAEGACDDRVARGGSWLEDPWDLRLARRYKVNAYGRETIVGIRLARDL